MIEREVECTTCGRQDVMNCLQRNDPATDCNVVAREPQFKISDIVFVRHRRIPFRVVRVELNKGMLGAHRYHLINCTEEREKDSGYASDLTMAPKPSPEPELKLIDEDTVEVLAIDPRSDVYGGSLDEYSPGARSEAPPGDATDAATDAAPSDPPRDSDPDAATLAGAANASAADDFERLFGAPIPEASFEIGMPGGLMRFGKLAGAALGTLLGMKPRSKELRYEPGLLLEAHVDRECVLYHAFIDVPGIGDQDRLHLKNYPDGMPVGILVTKEENCAIVWVQVVKQNAVPGHDHPHVFCLMEELYPTSLNYITGALEHGVLLARRKMPIATGDLEEQLIAYLEKQNVKS